MIILLVLLAAVFLAGSWALGVMLGEVLDRWQEKREKAFAQRVRGVVVDYSIAHRTESRLRALEAECVARNAVKRPSETPSCSAPNRAPVRKKKK